MYAGSAATNDGTGVSRINVQRIYANTNGFACNFEALSQAVQWLGEKEY